MTYLDLINRFWELDKIKPIPWIDSKLYMFLLNECNIRRWLNPFELQSRHPAICLGISRKTIVEVRNRLKLMGLICSLKPSGVRYFPAENIAYLWLNKIAYGHREPDYRPTFAIFSAENIAYLWLCNICLPITNHCLISIE